MTNLTTIARPYAKAVLKLAQATATYAQWSEMLSFLAMVVADPQTRLVINNQAISPADKAEFLCSIKPDILTQQAQSLIKILAQNNRLTIIPALYALYEQLREVAEQEVALQLVVAKDISAESIEQLLASIAKKFNEKVTMDYECDPSLIGGGKIEFKDGRVLDASVKRRLEHFYNHLVIPG